MWYSQVPINNKPDLNNQTQKDVNNMLEDATSIFEQVQQKWDKKLLAKIKEEYKELKESISASIKDDWNINKRELTKLQLEYWNIISIARRHGLMEQNSSLRKQAEQLLKKDVKEFTIDEAKWALEYLNQNYTNFEKATKKDKLLNKFLWTNSLYELKNKANVNSFQEKLIIKIIWKNNFKKWYNNEFLRWFNKKEKWNFLISIKEFEKSLFWKNAKDINSMALANYFKYLKSINSLDKQTLIKKMWQDSLVELWIIWQTKNNDIDSLNAKRELENIWLWEIIEETINFSKLFKLDEEDYFTEVSKLNQSEIFRASEYLRQNKSTRRSFLNKNKSPSKGNPRYLCPIETNAFTILNETVKIDFEEKFNDNKQEIIKNLTKRFNWEKALAETLFNNLEQSFQDNPCSFNLINIINNFNKKELKDFNKKNKWKEIPLLNHFETKDLINNLSNISLERYRGLNNYYISSIITLKETSQTSSLEERKKIQARIFELQSLSKQNQTKIISTKRVLTVNKNLTKENTNAIIKYKKAWKSNIEIMSILRKNNSKLDDALQKHEEKYKNYYLTKNKEKKEEKEYNQLSSNYSYIQNEWIITIDTNNWIEKKIKLSTNDKKLTKNNPEILENIINFYYVLKTVWLLKLWDIKESIFTSISNVKWIWFNITEGYLNKNETKIFLNSILKSCWEVEIPPVFTIESFIKKFENKNGVQSTGEEKEVNLHWESKIESIFLKKYFPKANAIWFKNADFEKSLQ